MFPTLRIQTLISRQSRFCTLRSTSKPTCQTIFPMAWHRSSSHSMSMYLHTYPSVLQSTAAGVSKLQCKGVDDLQAQMLSFNPLANNLVLVLLFSSDLLDAPLVYNKFSQHHTHVTFLDAQRKDVHSIYSTTYRIGPLYHIRPRNQQCRLLWSIHLPSASYCSSPSSPKESTSGNAYATSPARPAQDGQSGGSSPAQCPGGIMNA